MSLRAGEPAELANNVTKVQLQILKILHKQALHFRNHSSKYNTVKLFLFFFKENSVFAIAFTGFNAI